MPAREHKQTNKIRFIDFILYKITVSYGCKGMKKIRKKEEGRPGY
jgi:hypothetical protein